MRRASAVATGLALVLAPVMISPGTASADQRGNSQAIDYVVQRALSQRGVPFVYGGGNTSGPTSGVRRDATTVPGATGITPGTTGTLPGTTGTVPGSITSTPGVGGFPGAATVPGTNGFPGTAIAPSGGTLPAATTVGFDASGLIQYAFAGAGLKMPRTSGEQCSVGRKVPPAQARRGDLLCYGPGGAQSVAMYLGNGQMIEGTDPAVTVTTARTSNMMPYLTRVID